MYDSLSAELL